MATATTAAAQSIQQQLAQQESAKIKPHWAASFGLKLTCAGIAGVIGTALAFPLDMAKTRIQAQGLASGGPQLYRNVFQTIGLVYRTEGFGAIYKGLKPNLIFVFPEKGIKLGVNDVVRSHLADAQGNVSILGGCMAGATAGFCQVVATNPMELIKIQHQIPGNKETYMQTFRRLFFWKLYTGAPVTLMRDVPYSILYFGLYGYLEQTFATDPVTKNKNYPKVLGSALLSGMVAAFLMTPVDVVKTNVQAKDTQHKTFSSATRAVWRAAGIKGFFKGAEPRMIAIGALFAIAQFSYVVQKSIMRSLGWDA